MVILPKILYLITALPIHFPRCFLNQYPLCLWILFGHINKLDYPMQTQEIRGPSNRHKKYYYIASRITRLIDWFAGGQMGIDRTGPNPSSSFSPDMVLETLYKNIEDTSSNRNKSHTLFKSLQGIWININTLFVIPGFTYPIFSWGRMQGRLHKTVTENRGTVQHYLSGGASTSISELTDKQGKLQVDALQPVQMRIS